MARFLADAAHAIEQYDKINGDAFELFQVGEFKDVLLVGDNRLEAGWAWMREFCLANKDKFKKYVETERRALKARAEATKWGRK